MLRPYISFAPADAAFASRLITDLHNRGIEATYDAARLRPGGANTSGAALAASDTLILLLSPSALAFPPLYDEVNASIARFREQAMRAPIIVLTQPVSPASVPPVLLAYSWVDATTNYDAAFQQISRLLGIASEQPAEQPAMGAAGAIPYTPEAPATPANDAPTIVTPAGAPTPGWQADAYMPLPPTDTPGQLRPDIGIGAGGGMGDAPPYVGAPYPVADNPAPPQRTGAPRNRWVWGSVIAVVLILALTGLLLTRVYTGNRPNTSGGSPGTQTTATTSALSTATGGASGDRQIVIGTLFPVSGPDASVGLPTQYGADLAISQNANLGGGYTLSVQHENYEGAAGPDRTIAATEARTLVENPNVMAIVGPFNSGVTAVVMPLTNNAGLTMISPTNTNPGLTEQQYAAENGFNFPLLHPTGKPNAYFRTCGTDDVQGKVDADFTLSAPINARSAYVIDDTSVYGKTLAATFTSEFTAKGGVIMGSGEMSASWSSDQIFQLANAIASANPQVVFYGGVTSVKIGFLKQDLVQQNYIRPMVSDDGIALDTDWQTVAGSSAMNTYATVAGLDTSQLATPAGRAFVSAYNNFTQGKPDNTLSTYSVAAYDDAMIEITAIKHLIKAGVRVARGTVLSTVQGIHYQGLTGNISFDANGDNASPKVFSVYFVNDQDQWVYFSKVYGR